MASDPGIDVAQWINEQRISRLQILVIVLSGACALLEGFDAQNIGFVVPALIRQWSLEAEAFTPALMAGLAGLLCGCLVIAPLADRIGRKTVMVGSVAAFAFFSFVSAAAWSPASLSVLRFLTGFGVGGGMANAIALTSEFFPARKRAAMTVIMFTGFPIGASLGGFLSAYLIPNFGWQSVFIVGGIIPALLAMALVRYLPESIHHLVVQGQRPERVRAILHGINPRAAFPATARFIVVEEKRPQASAAHLFREGRAFGTVLIWVVFFMSLLDIYLIASWLPTILHTAGLSISMAAVVTAMTQFSGIVSCVAVAPALGRSGCLVTLLPAYLLAALGIAALGAVGTQVGWLIAAACIAGGGIVCGQITGNAYTAAFYPTYIRATGVGWALGIGRIGAIVGPGVGGLMIRLHWSLPTLFIVSAVPALIAAGAVLGLMWRDRRKPAVMAQARAA